MVYSVVYSWSCHLLVLYGVLLFVYVCVCIAVGVWLWGFAGCLGGFQWVTSLVLGLRRFVLLLD